MCAYIFLGIPGGWELLVIILVVLLIFGGRKIPELMRGLGQGMKEFKNATREEDKEKNKNKNEETSNNS
jgi:sec-independent protein translocase protein TatA